MDIGDDLQILSFADIPKTNESASVKGNDARAKRVTIQIVVTQELGHLGAAVGAKKERTALALTLATMTQFAQQQLPQQLWNLNWHRREFEGD